MPLEEVEDIIRHNPDVIVIVDEAYVDFGGQSALPLIENMTTFWSYRHFPSRVLWLG